MHSVYAYFNWRVFTYPKVNMSEGPIVRRSTCPKVHLSDGPLVRRFCHKKKYVDKQLIFVIENINPIPKPAARPFPNPWVESFYTGLIMTNAILTTN